MSESETLKPCPFCGSKPTVLTDELYEGSFSIECCQVGCRVNVQGETYDSGEEDKAIEHWNTRAGEHAAYERGKAEGAEAVRGRIVPLLNARKQTAAVSETRAQQNNKPHIAIVYHNEVEVWDEAINIVNQAKE